jgi:hypothetical protein
MVSIDDKGGCIMKRFELNDCRVRSDVLLSNFSEQDILELQDVFLTPGFNYLSVPSVVQGRRIIRSVLDSLNCFSPVACLTTNSIKLRSDIISLYDEMALAGALALSHSALESFLLEQFNYDFLWIECSYELMQAPWFCYFEQKLLDFNIAAQQPILFVEYDK